jgi:sulfonate dioxygenase
MQVVTLLINSIGTVVENIQLSQLTGSQLDDLVSLVNERGVLFFRNQDLTTGCQVELFEHLGILDKHPAQKDQRHLNIRGSNADWREVAKYTPWPNAEFHADTSFEINRTYAPLGVFS